MSGVTIYRNREPHTGGELVLYSSSFTNASKRLVFVNGVWNTPEDHAASCRNLCRLTGCEVLGVYNQMGAGVPWGPLTAGLFDAGQAITDWIGVGIRALGLGPNFLANGCASSLFDLLLYEGPRWPNGTTHLCIVAHSQGNLITSNALMLYSKMVKKYKLDHQLIHVFAIASPAPSWPIDPGNPYISVSNYWHRHDPITAASMWRNMRGSNKGEGAMLDQESWFRLHRLDGYLDNRELVDGICAKVGTKSPF